jgi:2-dehydropantoate 2-reductase
VLRYLHSLPSKELELKISVLGAGSLGCAIGGTLARAGADVTLINRRVEHVQAIRTQGLILREGGIDTHVRVRAASDCVGLGAMDLVIVLVKSFDTRSAMQGALNLVGPETVVLSLQNGLGHEDVLAELVGAERVLAGKTYVGGLLVAPGVVVAGTQGKETIIGELRAQGSARADRIAAGFNAAGLRTLVCEDIMGTIWDKLLINVATGALSGITRLPYGALYQLPQVKACAVAAVEEAMAVARASGITLSYQHGVDAWRKAATGLPYGFKASMLQSLEKGSLTEIDFINGAVVERGAALGVPTPVNATLVACIKGIERSLKEAS